MFLPKGRDEYFPGVTASLKTQSAAVSRAEILLKGAQAVRVLGSPRSSHPTEDEERTQITSRQCYRSPDPLPQLRGDFKYGLRIWLGSNQRWLEPSSDGAFEMGLRGFKAPTYCVRCRSWFRKSGGVRSYCLPSVAGDSRVCVALVPDPLADVLTHEAFSVCVHLMSTSRPQPKGHSPRPGPVVEGEA